MFSEEWKFGYFWIHYYDATCFINSITTIFSVSEGAAWSGSPLPQVAGAKHEVAASPAAADDDYHIDLFGCDE